jgi:hypothetical protein
MNRQRQLKCDSDILLRLEFDSVNRQTLKWNKIHSRMGLGCVRSWVRVRSRVWIRVPSHWTTKNTKQWLRHLTQARIWLRFDSVNRQTSFWACKFQHFLRGIPPNPQGAENLLHLSTSSPNRKIAAWSRARPGRANYGPQDKMTICEHGPCPSGNCRW